MTTPSVFQEWIFETTMQQQSVLVLACRGPDGIRKFHPTKKIVARYRASVMKAAYLGRAMKSGEGDATTFMTLEGFDEDVAWRGLCNMFFNGIDTLPHHFTLHLAHGAEIIGYKHPDPHFLRRWHEFYRRCCDDFYMTHETEHQMDRRLSDWDRAHWGEAS
ncbi:hypothetical protein AB7Z32_23905 [Bradyrhizobium sp. 482_C4_N1_1]|uniref:hypothetical protein n=1 Tax=unclassified Bradyrhizobium TaxID=2631580 RepID=UPI003F88848F